MLDISVKSDLACKASRISVITTVTYNKMNASSQTCCPNTKIIEIKMIWLPKQKWLFQTQYGCNQENHNLNIKSESSKVELPFGPNID